MTRWTATARILGLMSTVAAIGCGGERTTSPGGTAWRVQPRRVQSVDKKGAGDTTTSTIVVRPNKSAKITLGGGHFVVIPAGAICDVATSGYAAELWETPCTPQQQRLTVTTRSWLEPDGHPGVELSPDLRFTPDDSMLVWLVMYDSTAARDTSSRIAFCATAGGECVDEAVTDRDLDTRFDEKQQVLYRRLKHFGAYRVLARDSSAAQ